MALRLHGHANRTINGKETAWRNRAMLELGIKRQRRYSYPGWDEDPGLAAGPGGDAALARRFREMRAAVLDADGELRNVDAHLASERLPAAEALRAAYGLPPWEETHPVNDEGDPTCLNCGGLIGLSCCERPAWGDPK